MHISGSPASANTADQTRLVRRASSSAALARNTCKTCLANAAGSCSDPVCQVKFTGMPAVASNPSVEARPNGKPPGPSSR